MKIDMTHYAAPYLIVQREDGRVLGYVGLIDWDPQTHEGRVTQFLPPAEPKRAPSTTETSGKFTLLGADGGEEGAGAVGRDGDLDRPGDDDRPGAVFGQGHRQAAQEGADEAAANRGAEGAVGGLAAVAALRGHLLVGHGRAPAGGDQRRHESRRVSFKTLIP